MPGDTDDVMWTSAPSGSCHPRILVNLCTQNSERYLQMRFMKGSPYTYTFKSRFGAREDEHPPLPLASAFARKVSPLGFSNVFPSHVLGQLPISYPRHSPSPLHQIRTPCGYDPVKMPAAGVRSCHEEIAHPCEHPYITTKYAA